MDLSERARGIRKASEAQSAEDRVWQLEVRELLLEFFDLAEQQNAPKSNHDGIRRLRGYGSFSYAIPKTSEYQGNFLQPARAVLLTRRRLYVAMKVVPLDSSHFPSTPPIGLYWFRAVEAIADELATIVDGWH
jgi:hypothetical protein